MREEINAALKQAMRDKAVDRLSTLRLINAAIKDRDIAARSAGNQDGVSDAEILAILAKMVKERGDSAQAYEEAARLELAEKERAEVLVIEEFMPKQLSETEIEAAVAKVIKSSGAQNLRDIGRVMNELKNKYSGQMDFGLAGKLVKDHLG